MAIAQRPPCPDLHAGSGAVLLLSAGGVPAPDATRIEAEVTARWPIHSTSAQRLETPWMSCSRDGSQHNGQQAGH